MNPDKKITYKLYSWLPKYKICSKLCGELQSYCALYTVEEVGFIVRVYNSDQDQDKNSIYWFDDFDDAINYYRSLN